MDLADSERIEWYCSFYFLGVGALEEAFPVHESNGIDTALSSALSVSRHRVIEFPSYFYSFLAGVAIK